MREPGHKSAYSIASMFIWKDSYVTEMFKRKETLGLHHEK